MPLNNPPSAYCDSSENAVLSLKLSPYNNDIILPDALIWDLECKYLGYKTKLVKGKQKDKTGITKIPSEQFIKNLQILENDKELIEILLYLDFIKFKPVGPKRKELSLKQYLKEQLRDSNLKYSEFFENVLQKHDDVESYAKSLRKYIK